MDLGNINIYRLTHIKNIPHILKYGITHRRSKQANPNFVTIGDISLINSRSKKVVVVDNGDFGNLNCPSITLGDFIPFYFGIKMPMLYVIQTGGNFVEKPTLAENIIYLSCPISRIINSDNKYYFSDGHATDNLTTFYDKSKILKLPEIIDWNAVKASYWGGIENLDVKRKKQAEFLVSNDLPPNFIIGLVCQNEMAKQKLIKMGIEDKRIKIIPKAYY